MRHLSLFAMILKAVVATLVCSNAASIFSEEGFRSLIDLNAFRKLAPMLNMLFLCLAVALLCGSRIADLWHAQRKKEVRMYLRELPKGKVKLTPFDKLMLFCDFRCIRFMNVRHFMIGMSFLGDLLGAMFCANTQSLGDVLASIETASDQLLSVG